MLEYDGHDVFTTPSANMAAIFQVFETLSNTHEIEKARARFHVTAAQNQHMRKENSGYRMQSSTLHSARFRTRDEEANQPDLRNHLHR